MPHSIPINEKENLVNQFSGSWIIIRDYNLVFYSCTVNIGSSSSTMDLSPCEVVFYYTIISVIENKKIWVNIPYRKSTCPNGTELSIEKTL